MPKTSDYDKTHLRNLAVIATRIDRIFKTATEEAAKIGATITTPLREDKIFNFNDYPRTHQHIERLLRKLQESVETIIVNGVRSAWTLSNNKNNALSARVFGEQLSKLTEEQQRRYFSTNAQALESFLQRKAQGLNLSDRVWKYTDAFKHEIELALDLGIRSGESAAQMTRSLRQYLQHPDQLFRRVRDRHGLLQLSRAAQEFHPGTGVYRSSYKNARRLAATETNIAYRTCDHLRWQQMDFVVGIEIQLSNNHTVLLQPGERTSDPSQQRRDGSPKANAVRPLTDICDTLAGRYPKDFKFTGWHPHCRCRAISILKTDEELAADTARMLRGEEPTNASVNTVRDVPAAFKDWVKEHSGKIETARNLPYFIRDNQKRVGRILSKVEEVKKSPLEIAKERHDARTPEQAAAIQTAWSNRRVDNLRSAIDEGFLPKECAVAMDEIKGLIDAGKFDEANARIAFYQQRAATHAARKPKEIQAIKDAWAQKLKRDETTRLIADNVLKVARDYAEVDYSTLQKLIADNNLTKMREEARNVAQAVKAMRDEEKALSDLIPNAHEWHKSFTIAELKEAHAKIQATLDYWKAKGYDLATDSNLSILKTELEQKIQFVETPGAFKAGLKAHKTWQVQQDSYIKLLDKVENRIEIIKLDADYNTLLGFKTTSKDFKDYMAKAKAALDAGDPTTAKHHLSFAEWKKNSLEAKRKEKVAPSAGSPGGVSFNEMTKEDIKKLLDDFKTNTVIGVDKKLRPWMESEWGNLTYAEQKLLTRYTQAYSYLNDRLRGIPPKSWIPQSEYDHDMPIITKALNKLKVPHDIVVRRGTDNYEIKAIGKWLSQVKEGDIFTEPAFLSTAAHRGKGFFKNFEMVIVVPKGARGAFAEPFSHYNDSCSAYDYDYDRIWDGKTKQSIEDEFEWIGQRGCQFKVIEKTGNRIILQLIGQLK